MRVCVIQLVKKEVSFKKHESITCVLSVSFLKVSKLEIILNKYSIKW